ncbi:hypothetical protein C8J57DRAFT_1232741 [Mycena rebaudengoi]|nr:hypothetical protein C8J57DRAFT_1232741 [Mycena rebaudengoi]
MSGNCINSGPASFLSRYGKLLDGSDFTQSATLSWSTSVALNYCPNERSHQFLTINRNIKEELLRELLTNEEKLTSDVAVESESAVCARVLHPRNGAASTSKIFGGNIPVAFDPAIANPRIKHSLIQEMKKVKSPYGLGIEGYTENGFAHITQSEVKFKFIDGEGLRAILVDGNKPQENTLGACVISNSYFSTFFEHAYFILRAGAKTIAENLPTWQRPSLMSLWAELEDLHILKPRKKWKNSTDPNLANSLPDWISDKYSIPWLFPSINGLLSAIPEDDWCLTPGDTNLNETACPYTNQHTETTLLLLEAIER